VILMVVVWPGRTARGETRATEGACAGSDVAAKNEAANRVVASVRCNIITKISRDSW